MIKRSGGAFQFVSPPIGAGENLRDLGSVNSSVSAYSGGATNISPTELYPEPGKRWSILGFSVNANMTLLTGSSVPAQGQLGKLLAGLSQLGPASPNVAGIYSTPMLPFPADATSMVTLFDPQVDKLPPFVSNAVAKAPQPLPLVDSLTLPEPLVVPPGSQIFIGLWLTPSLTVTPGGTAMTAAPFITDAVYSVIYDDGLGTDQ